MGARYELPRIDSSSEFLDHIHIFDRELPIRPQQKHPIACIQYSDLKQLRAEFLEALIKTSVDFVYSPAEQEAFLDDYRRRYPKQTIGRASAALVRECRSKFRLQNLQGQFAELLLFNVITDLFGAEIAVRKMQITTNTKLERNGADAIHIANCSGINRLLLGEAKAYTSSFMSAFRDAVSSICDQYDKHLDELSLYKTSSALAPSARQLIIDYLNRAIDLPVHLISIIAYCCGDEKDGDTTEELLEEYFIDAYERCEHISDAHYGSAPPRLIQRMTFIFFPVNDLKGLLNDFNSRF